MSESVQIWTHFIFAFAFPHESLCAVLNIRAGSGPDKFALREVSSWEEEATSLR
jgi:hypothetical protein